MTTQNKMRVNTNQQIGPHNWKATIQRKTFFSPYKIFQFVMTTQNKMRVDTNHQRGPHILEDNNSKKDIFSPYKIFLFLMNLT